jgi:hypothetical protein
MLGKYMWLENALILQPIERQKGVSWEGDSITPISSMWKCTVKGIPSCGGYFLRYIAYFYRFCLRCAMYHAPV